MLILSIVVGVEELFLIISTDNFIVSFLFVNWFACSYNQVVSIFYETSK